MDVKYAVYVAYAHLTSDTRAYYFSDHAAAMAAYDLVKTAMGDYREYGNDHARTVEIVSLGGTASVRISLAVEVYFADLDTSDDVGLSLDARKARTAKRGLVAADADAPSP